MLLKGFMSKIGAVVTALGMAYPVMSDGIQGTDLNALWQIGGGLLLALGIIRKVEAIEKK